MFVVGLAQFLGDRSRNYYGYLPLLGPFLPRLRGRPLRCGTRRRQQCQAGPELVPVALEEAFELLADVLLEVPSVGYLPGLRRRLVARLSVGTWCNFRRGLTNLMEGV